MEIPITNDLVLESVESFIVELSTVDIAVVLEPREASVAIISNDCKLSNTVCISCGTLFNTNHIH